MQLKIHSENTPNPTTPKMGGNKRGKRKTSESSSVPNTPNNNEISKSKKKVIEENGGSIKMNGKSPNGEVFTPRRSRRKASESSVTQTDLNSKTPLKARKDSESSVSRERKNSESFDSRLRKISESSNPRDRKTSESSNSRDRKNSESSNPRTRKNSEVVSSPVVEKPTGTKRKNSESGKTDVMSVADRIKLLSHDQNQKSTPPRTDSVLQLLLQGLNSKDKRILESVLERADDDLINDTVKRLPIEAVTPLLEVLQHYIQGKVALVFGHGKWLKAVLRHHTSYVMSSPDCEEIIASINAVIESRTKNYQQILQLRGKLEMMVQQVTAQAEDQDKCQPLQEPQKEALLVYHDDDSSDGLSDKLDDMLMPASDTDNDDWENNEQEESDVEDVVELDGADESEEESDDNAGDQPMVNGVGSDSSDEEDMDAD